MKTTQRPGRWLLAAVALLGTVMSPPTWASYRTQLDLAMPADSVAAMPLSMLHADSTRQLTDLFDSQGFAWPPSANRVPPVVVRSLPADFSKLRNPALRKAIFLRTLVPLVLLENQRITQQRQALLRMFGTPESSWNYDQRSFINALALEYGVRGTLTDPQVQKEMLLRVDQIPAALVIGQAVLESGWGGAARMLERNSLFGVKRAGGYGNLQESVRAYMLMLNANKPYAKLRQLRASMRAGGETIDPLKLAHGLTKYSTRGRGYVRDVIATIRRHELTQLGELELRG